MSESDAPPPPDPDPPRRLSFREANLGPEHRPEPHDKPPGFFAKRKRSVAVGLVAFGAGAAVLYGVAHRNPDCDQQASPNQTTSCAHSGGGGSGHSYGFSSGGSSSDASHAGSTSHGGFGGSGSAHAGGGGE